jgi:hypothetical protein
MKVLYYAMILSRYHRWILAIRENVTAARQGGWSVYRRESKDVYLFAFHC